MKASLQLKVSQNLTMTPQLQQAIKLLQLSSLELQLEIQQMLETNPLLESDDTGDELAEDIVKEDFEPDSDNDFEQYSAESMHEFSPDDLSEDINSDPSQNNLESSLDNSYYESPGSQGSTSDDYLDIGAINSADYSLTEHLLNQLNLCRMTERDQAIGYLLIDSLDNRGYLNASLEQVLDTLNSDINEEEQFSEDELLAVLHRIQQFDPIGIAAQDLQECLLLQLKHLPTEQTYVPEAIELVSRYLHYLGSKDFTQIRRKTRFSEATLTKVLKLIQSLNPNPASQVVQDQTDYITPDIIIKKNNGQWLAELNEDSMPKVRINEHYASLASQPGTSKHDKQYLKNNLQEARWFIKSLKSRHETLLRVAREILKVQEGFFEHGEEAMKPLVLHDIAERVDMHESTISRVTTQKYMLTPKGVFELKYFFSSHVGTDAGGECSSTAIRAHIRKLVSNENHKKPLSDSKIAALLADQGIKVARRTIAKYRESLGIPPSNERKQLL